MRNAAAVLIALLTAASGPARIITVDDDNPAEFNNIQAAIDDSNDGDVIVVAEGTYFENINFKSKNITLRSTDPNNPDVIAATVIDGNNLGSVVTFAGTEDETCVLAGFTIQNGKVDYGAGISGSEPAGTNPTRATIQNNIITRNVARWDGGGLFCCNGTIQNNVITNNLAGAGGGGLAYCDGVIQNNIVTNNSAIQWYGCGGGLYNCNGTIQNNTIFGNSANHRGGGLYECYGFIPNCIIWGNRASDCGNQLYESNSPFFSCIQDWTGGGNGNINQDPLFVDAPGGDYHLQATSPCIDRGANGYWFFWPLRDLDGNCRLADRRVDMGCYEYGASRDSDGDLLCDSDELRIGTDLYHDDTDSDGLRDGLEVLRGSDPLNATLPRIVYVRPEISTIQESLGIAVDGDEIVVEPGIYVENLRFFGLNVTLRSADPRNAQVVASTILDGGGSGPVVSFTGNESEKCLLAGFTMRGGRASRGGGILGNGTHATIQRNMIIGNSATGRYADGGALYCCDGTIQSNVISGNWAHDRGGGLFSCGGLVRNNTISGNWASNYGGGLYCCDGTIQNNVVANNWTYDCAGGLGWCKGTILNNTVIGNWTDNNADNLGWCDGPIVNCIIWGNTETDLCASSTPSFSCIQGWTGTLGGQGNIGTDPCFADPNNGDYHLKSQAGRWDPNTQSWVKDDVTSPCIDAGDPNYLAEPNETDLDGRSRVIGGRIDMGAYEYARQPPGIIYVDTRATGANNGFSWKDAFNHLQDGLAAASAGDEIRVAQGTYKPDKGGGITPGDRAASFHLTNGTIVKGGYAGFNAPDPDARDIRNYETILSGDVGNVADFSDNSYHIVQGGDNAILEGFTVFGGNANGSFQGGYGIGGGLYNDNCRLVVANCTFEQNAAFNGGAIFSRGRTLAVHESIFAANLALQGGALVNLNGHMTLTRCVLSNNADGTIFCFGNGALQVESCVFDNNYGGWHAIDRSGAGNVIEVINSLFTHNAGGAINSGYNSLFIVNSTLVDNHTTTFGGAVCCSYGSLSAVNCIMWGNTAGWGGDEIFGADAAITVSYSCIAGGYPGTGNINMNPLFRAPASEDYHLLAGSPCIDAGDNSAVPPVIKTDLDGRPRVIGGRIDMGAYEMLPWVKVPMKFTPQALNCKGKGKWVKAQFILPAEFTVEDVDSNSPAMAQPPGIESEYMSVFVNDDGVVEIEAAFERAAFCDAVKSCGPIEITVTGSLTSGQYFYGKDTIKIIKSSFECLAFLSSHWLELNCGKPDCCDGFDADRDTTVNLKDFAIMALRWMESH